jgi:hypothetical protein
MTIVRNDGITLRLEQRMNEKRLRRPHSRGIYWILLKACQAYDDYENQFVYGIIAQKPQSHWPVWGALLGANCTFRFPEFIIDFPPEELTEERKALCEKVYAALTPLRDLLATDEWDSYSPSGDARDWN